MTETRPIIFDHMLKVYRELEHRADGDTLKFEGSKVEAFRAVGISQGYYTEIFDSLTEMGCIQQIRRGAGKFGSVIQLVHPPEYHTFTSIYKKRLTKPSEADTVRQQLKDMERRLPDIDLKGFIISLDQRLGDLEARLVEVEKKR